MHIEGTLEAPPRKPGRPSHYPALARYNEDAGVYALMQLVAEREGLSFAEFQRLVNRAGLQALRLVDA